MRTKKMIDGFIVKPLLAGGYCVIHRECPNKKIMIHREDYSAKGAWVMVRVKSTREYGLCPSHNYYPETFRTAKEAISRAKEILS